MLIKSMIIAFSMYSRIPMPKVEWDSRSMKYAFCFFPFIGAILGVIMWLVGRFLMSIDIGPILFGCIMTVIPVFVTGGIHLDGFLDTMDGINSYADTEKRLEILKDSNSGAFAIIGGLVYFILSVGFWSEVNSHMLNIICIGYVMSRALSGLSMVCFPMAKKTGLAVTFGNGADKIKVRITMAVFIVIECIVAVYINTLGGCVMIFTAMLCFGYHYYNCMKNFGGITGDLAGHFLQICELCIIIANVILYRGCLV